MNRCLFSSVVISILLLGLSGLVFAAGPGVNIKTVAVIPFESFTVEDLSIDVTHVVTDVLARHRFNIISDHILDDFLVKRRIRRTDFLDKPAIRAMGTTCHSLSSDHRPTTFGRPNIALTKTMGRSELMCQARGSDGM